MCPACITTVTWIAAGVASTGGLAALVVSRFGGKESDTQSEERNRQGNPALSIESIEENSRD